MSALHRIVALSILLAGCATDAEGDRIFERPDVGNEDGGAADMENEVKIDLGRADSGIDVDIDDMDIPGLCQPNRDGVIERNEVTLEAGLSATFSVASNVDWSTAGSLESQELSWDLGEEFRGERDVLVTLEDLGGSWFETSFPTADYATPLSSSADLLGVFRATDDAVELLGVVSPDDGLFRTELTYDPPVSVLQFPLSEGASWSVESTVSGLYDGVASLYTETYRFEVDANGRLTTPYADFSVLRVRSVMEREVALLTTVVRSFAFVSECFGTVATVAAQENESGVEFSDVAELRRLAP